MNRVLTLSFIERKILLLLGDLSIVFFNLYLLTNKTLKGVFEYEKHSFEAYFIGVAFFSIIAYTIDIYNLERASKLVEIVRLSFIVGILYSFGIFFLAVLLINTTFSRPYLILFLVLMPFSLSIWRVICSKFFISSPFLKNTVYIYDEKFKEEIKENIETIEGIKKSNGYDVKLTLPASDKIFSKNIKRQNRIIEKIDTVIIRISDYQHASPSVEQFLTKTMFYGKEVFTFSTFYESTYEALPLTFLGNNFYEVLELKNKKKHYLHKLFNVCVNFVFSLIIGLMFLLSLPFVLLINLFLNPGPLFYKQNRVGKKGKEYLIYKYRSMVVNAEKNGAMMAKKNDSRITRFGKFMRKYRIDELPQVISVIKGDMSLIGPRPERKIFVDELISKTSFYSVRHIIKPGITGWAQVKYKYGENLKDSIRKLEYDLFYIKNRSILLDVRIIFKTITTVLFSKGV